MPSSKKFKKKQIVSSNLVIQIGIATLAGCVAGLTFGEKMTPMGELSLIFIRSLKFLATPLVFFSIVDAFSKTVIPPRNFGKLFLFSTLNASVAGAIALGLAFLFPAQNRIELTIQNLPPNATQSSVSPPFSAQSWIFDLLQGNHLFVVILLALSIGILLRKTKERTPQKAALKKIETLFYQGFTTVSKILQLFIKLIPIAIFGSIAKWVGLSGLEVFKSLESFVLLISAGLFIHCVIYYSFLLRWVAGVSPFLFFKNAKEAIFTAFGTGSSLATLPVTLKALQEKMKIPPETARLVACIGTNLNHDGILLYEASAALFIAQIYQIPLNLTQKIQLLGTSALAAVGIAGVPEAGLITLSLVLASVGLPTTLVPVLMTVDWFIGRLRATTSVTSDLVVATLINKKY